MTAYIIFLILVFIIGVNSGSEFLVPPSPCILKHARYLPIYDLNRTSLNVVRYDDILESFRENGFFKFDDVEEKYVGGMLYGNYPVLVVYQPDENIRELHGYYLPLPWGLRRIYDTDAFSPEDYVRYQAFRDFLNSPIDKEGYTPSAAIQRYPELKDYKLTKIVEIANNLTPKFDRCAVLFVVPKKDVLKETDDILRKTYTLFEDFYYDKFEICKPSHIENDDIEYVYDPLWKVFDHLNSDDNEYNVLNFGPIDEAFSQNGYYRFEKFNNDAFFYYLENPTLIVVQPNEKVPELHGYYFDRGVQSLLSPGQDDAYTPFFEYLLKETDLDGFTPDAARFDYPYFFDYKLTRFIHNAEIAERFAVLFLAPARYRPTNFDDNYFVIEEHIMDLENGDVFDL